MLPSEALPDLLLTPFDPGLALLPPTEKLFGSIHARDLALGLVTGFPEFDGVSANAGSARTKTNTAENRAALVNMIKLPPSRPFIASCPISGTSRYCAGPNDSAILQLFDSRSNRSWVDRHSCTYLAEAGQIRLIAIYKKGVKDDLNAAEKGVFRYGLFLSARDQADAATKLKVGPEPVEKRRNAISDA
jgi:hypothetical protein